MNCAIYSWKKFTLNVRPLESEPANDFRACSCLTVGAIVLWVLGSCVLYEKQATNPAAPIRKTFSI